MNDHDGVNVGRAQGGPLDGQTVSSRFPKGFLLVDKANGHAWVYAWNGIVFIVQDSEPRELIDELRWETAEGSEYDVMAYSADEEAKG